VAWDSRGRVLRQLRTPREEAPEYFKTATDAREHVEAVLSNPEYAIPHPSGKTLQLVEMTGDGNLVAFRAILKGAAITS
jgi:hypothetical protein